MLLNPDSSLREVEIANPTPNLLVFATLADQDGVEGVVEIFQRADTQPSAQRGYLWFLVQMAELASDWLKGDKLRSGRDQQSTWRQVNIFSSEVHGSLDLLRTARTIADEGRRLLACDRLSLALVKIGNCEIQAVSGQDLIERRSALVIAMRKLAGIVCDTGEPLEISVRPNDVNPTLARAARNYLEESGATALAVLPIRKPAGRRLDRCGDVIGALVVENFAPGSEVSVTDMRAEFAREHSSLALANALEYQSLLRGPVTLLNLPRAS
ncbi:MAG: GAF domain-containing protein [Pirellulaceae bacterium]